MARFHTIDPLAEKYYSISPYAYCMNNPLMFVDPDGKEGIVISGQPGDHKNKEHFLNNGLDRAKAAQNRMSKGESVTWIIYSDGSSKAGHDSKLLASYSKRAEKIGINVKVMDNSDEIISYVNNKDGGRSDDQISNFYYVGHATPGDLDVGYEGSGAEIDPRDFKSDAFKSGARVNVVAGCRTAVDGFFEKSIVRQFQGILDTKSNIYGSNVRTNYTGGILSDEQLLKTNNGKIIHERGKLPIKK